MAFKFGKKDFKEWVKQGLKVSHGANLDIDKKISLVPRAPVAFAFVTQNGGGPAMIPLPMNWFTLKIDALPTLSALHILFKATWSVRLIESGHFCDIFVAVPAPCTPGFKGLLYNFKIEIPNCSKADVEPCYNGDCMFDDVHFIQRSQGFREEKQNQLKPILFSEQKKVESFFISKFRRCKIRVSLGAGVDRDIHNILLNCPHLVISKYEGHVNLLHESGGPDVEWPDRPLSCSFICVNKEAPVNDLPTDEVVEPPEKKMRLPTEAS